MSDGPLRSSETGEAPPPQEVVVVTGLSGGGKTAAAKLFEDLDLDSIDAVDLVVRLQDLTGRKIKPDQFKTVRTVSDVVDRVHDLLAE